jgi:hypothetical protein
MSDEVKNRPQIRVGIINEILSEVIFIMMDQPLWGLSAGSQFCSCVEMLHFGGTPDMMD